MQTTFKRIWCKTCNNFELHKQKYPNFDDWICKECGTKYTSIKLSEIPENKLKEQRKRYNDTKKNMISDVFLEVLKSPEQRTIEDLKHMFSPPGSDIEIIESDAGQRYIDEQEEKIRIEEKNKKLEQYQKDKEEVKRYKSLNRNDICICGSNKKYKNCCLKQIKEKWAKL